MTWVSASMTAMALSSGVQRRPVVDVLEPQRSAEQPLLQGTTDRAFDSLPHGSQTDGIRIVSEDRRLLLKVLSRKEQVRQLGSPGALVGHFLGSLKGLEQLQRHPRMLLENAVLHDHVVVRLETSGLSIELVHDPLAVVVQQLPEARVAVDQRTAPAVDDRRVSGGDTRFRADGRARVALA